MGHSKIYNNDSKYVIANVMDDVENVNLSGNRSNGSKRTEFRHDMQRSNSNNVGIKKNS